MVIWITRLLGVCVITVLLAGCGGSPAPNAPLACATGSGRPLEGLAHLGLPCLARPARTVTVTAMHGRPEVINLWASWCGPCRRELPLLEQAHRTVGDRVLFLGVDVRDSRSRALAFLGDHGVSYPQVYDEAGAVARAFRFAGVPDTVVVDARGHVVYRHAGELDRATLEAALAKLGLDVRL